MISNANTNPRKGKGGNPPLNVEEKNDELLKDIVSQVSLKKT
jgi:hypothetical protein